MRKRQVLANVLSIRGATLASIQQSLALLAAQPVDRNELRQLLSESATIVRRGIELPSAKGRTQFICTVALVQDLFATLPTPVRWVLQRLVGGPCVPAVVNLQPMEVGVLHRRDHAGEPAPT